MGGLPTPTSWRPTWPAITSSAANALLTDRLHMKLSCLLWDKLALLETKGSGQGYLGPQTATQRFRNKRSINPGCPPRYVFPLSAPARGAEERGE